MSRSGTLCLAIVCVFAWALSPNITRAGDTHKLNVLFIMADDLRNELASYGSPAITPNLDRLAKRSVQFQKAYCQQTVCNPSRSSMLTGRRPDTLQIWNNSTHFRDINPDVMTLPLWFKQHGYTTRCVGKIFHNWHTEVKGDVRSWSAPEFLHYANHGNDKPEVPPPLPDDYATSPRCTCLDVPDEAYYDGRVANEAVRVLGEVRDQPFFLAVGFWKPHSPMNAPKHYWDIYQRDKLPKLNPARPEGAPEIAFHQSTELRGMPPNSIDFTPEQAAEIRQGYFANITYMDRQLGKVLDALDASGVADRTAIVFVSDHGYHLGEQGLWGKTSVFELDARVPMMIATPDCAASSKTEALAELVDLFPTLVDVCHLPTPEGLEGKSLTTVLKDPTAQVKAGACTQHPRPAYYDREPSKTPTAMGVSVRTDRVRYTEWRDWKTGKPVARELYDHVADPAEMRNAIDQPSLADAQQKAAALLAETFPTVTHP
jgi:iduronate 2-sulfatase